MTTSTGALQHGDRAAREVSTRIAGNFATTAALTALSPKQRSDGMVAMVGTQLWVFIAGSTTGASGSCLVPDDVSSNSGRWKTNTGSTTIEASTKPVVSGVAAVGAASSVSASDHVHPPSISIPIAAESAASDTTAEKTIHVFTGGAEITGAWIHPTGPVTASDSVYATITLKQGDGAGGARSTVATLVTNVAGGSWVAFTKKSMGAITNGTVAARGIATLTVAKASTGTQLPAFVLELVCG